MGHIEVMENYLAAVERFDAAGMAAHLHADVVFTEMPNAINRAGSRRTLEVMVAGLAKGRQILQSQRYIMGEIISAGDRLVAQIRWEGVLAIPLGRLQPGEAMIAHICMIVRFAEGKIIEQCNYDCYEDFAAT